MLFLPDLRQKWGFESKTETLYLELKLDTL